MKINQASRINGETDNFLSRQQELIRELKQAGHEVISLGRGSPDLPTFPDIVDEFLQDSKKPLNHGYPPYGGKQSLKVVIQEFYQSEYGVELSLDEITIFSGSLAAITALPMVLLNPGDYALIPDPAFFGYQNGVKMAGGRSYPLPLKADHQYLPSYDQIPPVVLKQANLLFLNYPNNPTGAGATREFFEETVSFAKQNQIPVVHDFAYADISFHQSAPSFLSVPGAKDVGVELYTLSKTFNMAGWRIAFAVGNQEIIHLIEGFIRASFGGVFGAIQDAVEFGLLNSQEGRANLRAVYQNRQTAAVKLLKGHHIEVLDSAGTFFLWIKLPNGVDDVQFANDLLKEKYVAVVAGSTFGEYGKGYIRVSLVDQTETILEALKRLISFIEENG
ncbi:aminotransferase class I/II-fold pyridoxal phosphate-dependent enzyme [Limosilactobacillus gastricus]|uniref:aminotransferase class I/II-fold pyridoxal phosphate-dependent enzyme n=1 Tax=Limosilactobacillus gastricus TaxID=227942 RepID=UPI0026EBD21E|nr:aminotransferase class I/II-fold pyridoxal phosphate-dependent enzyme [Limosilactobacillus gastricus]